MNNNKSLIYTFLALLMTVILVSGCASTSGPRDPGDPWEPFNRAMYEFNDAIDRAVLKPVAKGYNAVLPSPVNKGITNFFSNLDDVVVLVNNLLQAKFPEAASDASRIFFNTTAGLLGFIDVATYLDMPKHNEDFGQTLGYWGVSEGPFLVLPLLGPSNVRDTVGRVGDWFIDPVRQVDPSRDEWALRILRAIDTRAGLLSASRVLEEAALDPYIFTRDAFLQRRRNLVHDGNPPPPELDE